MDRATYWFQEAGVDVILLDAKWKPCTKAPTSIETVYAPKKPVRSISFLGTLKRGEWRIAEV